MSESRTELELRDAIEALYVACKQQPPADAVFGCSHCVTDAESRDIVSKPLRELASGELERYAFKAITTWGTVDDFRYFLPRLLEIIAQDGEVGYTDAAVVLGKLRYAHWHEWPMEQRSALIRYLDLLWLAWLHRPVENELHSADHILEAIGAATDEIVPYLSVWRDAQEAEPVRKLALFVQYNSSFILKKGKLPLPVWDDRPAHHDAMLTFLCEPRTRDAMEACYWRFAAEAWADELSAAENQLSWICTKYKGSS